METWWELGEHSGFQGSELATYQLRCAFCGTKGNFAVAHRESKAHAEDKDKVLCFDTLKCGNCANYLMVFWSAGSHLHDYKVVPWYLGDVGQPPKSWPAQVGRFWQQARRALAREDLDAATVMARSALQAALRARDAEGKTLRGEIDDLASQGLLPPTMKEWAHELRLLGNSSAHPAPTDDVLNRKDVRDVIEFLEYLLSYLFTLPDRIKTYRERRG